MSDKIFDGVARKKKLSGFLFAISFEVKEKGNNGFGDKNAGENGHVNITTYDFIGSSKVNDDVGNEKSDGSKNFNAKNVGKCGVVGFFGTGFTKSVMIKTSKNSGI